MKMSLAKVLNLLEKTDLIISSNICEVEMLKDMINKNGNTDINLIKQISDLECETLLLQQDKYRLETSIATTIKDIIVEI